MTRPRAISWNASTITTGKRAWALRKRSTGVAALAAGLYALNPAIWYVSSIWGQTDSLYTVFVVASVVLLERGWVVPAWLCYSLAFATKLQSFAFAPLLVDGKRALRAEAVEAAVVNLGEYRS